MQDRVWWKSICKSACHAGSGLSETRAMPGDLPPHSPAAPRMLFLDALRAVASLVILWHHLSIYPPLCNQVRPLVGSVVDWFHDYARVTQVFFVVGGYVMARSMSGKSWGFRSLGVFFMHRYCRLGIPYLAAIGLAILACAMGRGFLPENVVGATPTGLQLLAHLLFIQDLLGIEQLSAGLWFVCINFQLGLLYSILLVIRDARSVPCSGKNVIEFDIAAGWVLAAASLFYFNRDARWDATALYFFPHFFMGILVQRSLRTSWDGWMFLLYLLLMGAGLAVDWRGRLVSALVVGCLLYAADRGGWSSRWPKSRLVARLGRMSYSLFLVHFPVLVIVSTVWVKVGWSSPWQAAGGLFAAFVASLGMATLFYRCIEKPAGALSRRWVVPGRRNHREYPPAT